ncbi:dual 3',5'-cyclic-AMP and -GMP phosphodiesterase 11 [Caerostris darwini]|uniref:3',5'-cyclic-GMP phosphodiesterase n=1 Tax=Caerostris darwini TaxID=1538125 RepID=A0AAV4X692_9ARAC|nr:dual 3',5'-cyclic-AMP and -GMP phosphodiesterase 11 [Caerostris darwini]
MVDSWLLFHSVPQGMVQDTSWLTNTSPGAVTPVRKTSAHELERKTGFSRPFLPTFKSLPLPSDAMPFCDTTGGYSVLTTQQELRALNERELIFELVKDIYNGLDPLSFCLKILQIISILTKADRCSLFLVKGEKGDPGRCLVGQLLDVSCSSAIGQMRRREEICIPWGTGIVGHVAESRKSLNIHDCYKDIRFNSQVDRTTGYKTHNMLCMPICDTDGEVKAVAQIINKCHGEKPFTYADEEVFSRYLQFCGIGLRNAELYERSELESKRIQVLLDLARLAFEDQSEIGQIVQRIMIYTQSFLQVERCQVLLLDENAKTFSRVFDLDINDMKAANIDSSDPFEGRFPINVRIAGYVATSGETLNIPDVHQDDRFDPSVDEDSNFRHYSILCMPIRNASKIIVGVCQLINKLSRNPFTKKDERIFEICTIFCGLGIQHIEIYERSMKAIAKTKVTLEVLSYHATAPLEEVQELLRDYHIPSTEMYKLHDLKFDDFFLNDKEMLKACLRMFIDLNFIQRFDIEYDVLCRWLLSVRKNYRPVTYHNWRHAFNVAQMMFAILAGNQILSHLSSEEYMNVVHILEGAILATDLTVYYKAMLMTACDIAAITKPWKVQKKDMMNRDKKDKLPLMQVAFIDSMCIPVYEAFAMISDELCPLLEGVKENRAKWLKLAEEKKLCFSPKN